MDSDATLVARYRQGDQAAFSELLERYRGPVFAFIMGRVGDRQHAEDLAQETFVRCFSGIQGLRQPEAFVGWLFRIAGNLIQDRYRRRTDEQMLVADCLALERSSPPEELSALDEKMRVARQIGALPDRQRVVILLRHQVGLSCREIATVLGAPVGSVTKWLSRAYSALRQAVEVLA